LYKHTKSFQNIIMLPKYYDGGAHRPIEHIQGFTWSHWMLPSGECLRRIAPAAAMVDEFE
jgi:hypothetical protein